MYENDGPPDYHFTERWVLDGDDYQESYATPALGDYDNDGDLALFLTAVYHTNGYTDEAVLYRNDGNWNFTDVTDDEGLGSLGYANQGNYQAAWADFDNDGDLDLATAGRLFVNQGNANHWLKVHLTGNAQPAFNACWYTCAMLKIRPR